MQAGNLTFVSQGSHIKEKGTNYVRILKQKWKPASSSLLEANEVLFRANSKQTILHTAKGY